MGKITKSFFLLVSIMLAAAFSSCDWDDLDAGTDIDHPLYVSYTISADTIAFQGPEQVLKDIKTWIKANQVMFDRQVNYSTGDPSEFAKTDAEAIKKYDDFVPKFKSFLDDVKRRIAEGTYATETQPKVTVKAKFFTYASRVQGSGRELKSDSFELISE